MIVAIIVRIGNAAGSKPIIVIIIISDIVPPPTGTAVTSKLAIKAVIITWPILTVSIPPHGHNLEHGIYEDASAVPTNCSLWVNHQLVLNGFGYNLVNYDIKQYLTTGENLIEILSDTNGRVKCSLNICGFLTW